MDNRSLRVVSEGKGALAQALVLIWPNAPGGKATHYKVVRLAEKTCYYVRPGDVEPPIRHQPNVQFGEQPLSVWHSSHTAEVPTGGVQTLVLFWHEDRDTLALPYPLTLAQATEFVWGWLEHAEYGPQPDHDGDNDKGWCVFTESWGKVANYTYSIVGVQPVWAMYGK